MSDEEVVPKHAHLWLTPEQQEEWVTAKKQVPTLIFASFVAFNALAGLSLKIVNRKGLVTHPKNKALLQYGVVSATYALLSLAASVYLMVRRDLSHCGQQVFCVDDMSGRLLDFRAGWALFEILFWQNHSAVVQPWKEMVFLHNVVMILQSVAARMYPCILSLHLLPLQQLLEVASLVDCARRFTAIFGAPWHVRFKLQLAMMGAYVLKALAGAGLAAYSYWWLRDNNLWTLDLPESMSVLNQVYGMICMAGSVILALIYLKWMGAAITMTSELVDSVQSSRSQVAGQGKKGAAAERRGVGNGNRKKEKQRRG